MSNDALLAPPIPPNVDLRDLPYMPLHVVRLRDSETAFKTKGNEFRCAVLLWCVAWHQVPASSLPDDDASLAQYAGFGIAVKEWRKVRAGALRGFVKCSDGRLYHNVLATVAINSWISKLRQQWWRACERLKKQAQRNKVQFARPDFEVWISRECPEAMPYVSRGQGDGVPEDGDSASPGQGVHVPGETGSNRSEVKVNNPVVTIGDTRDSTAPASAGNPRPEGRKDHPPRVSSDTPAQARLRAEGWRKGIKPGRNESWDAFESRVRTTRDAA